MKEKTLKAFASSRVGEEVERETYEIIKWQIISAYINFLSDMNKSFNSFLACTAECDAIIWENLICPIIEWMLRMNIAQQRRASMKILVSIYRQTICAMITACKSYESFGEWFIGGIRGKEGRHAGAK